MPAVPKNLLTMTQAARKHLVGRQCIFNAIKKNRLPAIKINSVYFIDSKDLTDYFNSKYDRKYTSVANGVHIFDVGKGHFSTAQAAKILGRSRMHIYYLIRMGQIHPHRVGGQWIILRKDLEYLIKRCDLTTKYKRSLELLNAV